MLKKLLYIPSNIKILRQKNCFIFMNLFDNLHFICVRIPDNIIMNKKRTLLFISFEEINGTTNLSWFIFLKNLIRGGTNPFFIRLVLSGVGYKVISHKNNIELKVGYSHSLFNYFKPLISISSSRNVIIDLKSPLKDYLGTEASTIQKYRKPDVYKNKGVIYKGEKLQLKIGKKA